MKQHMGATKVKAGFYWRTGRWEIVPVEGSGSVLPGKTSETYYRIPTLGMLLAALGMGAAFVVFLPIIGFALVTQLPMFSRNPIKTYRKAFKRS